MRKPSSVTPLLKSSELTSGRTFSRMTSPAIVGLKFSSDAELLELIVTAGGALHDGHRELAAGEEARLLAVVGDQVRLGEALEIALLLERLDDGADPFLRLKKKRFRKSLKTSPSPLSSSKSGAGNCCVVDAPAERHAFASEE